MAEVLPQIRLRADAQSPEASSKVDTLKSPPLRDGTNSIDNGRVKPLESVEGETPSLEQLGKITVLVQQLILLLQHDIYQIRKIIPANLCKPFQVIRQLLRAGLPPRKNEEIRKQSILYHTYVAEYLGHWEWVVLRYCAGYPQQNEYPKYTAFKDALRRL